MKSNSHNYPTNPQDNPEEEEYSEASGEFPLTDSLETQALESPARDNSHLHSAELPYTDLSPRCWKEEDCDVILDSLWLFPTRDKRGAHNGDYHGNFIPQVPYQVIRRYTKAQEVVVDLFSGSGTTAIEATNLGRHFIGVELRPQVNELATQRLAQTPNQALVHQALLTGDSGAQTTAKRILERLKDWGFTQAHHVILHPPYWDIIAFSEHQDPQDLSSAGSEEDFYRGFAKVAQTAWQVLLPGRFLTLVIGDKYFKGQWIPLGFGCMQACRSIGFCLKAINVKDIHGNEKGKGSTTNLWKYRAMRGGFYIFKHEYVMILQKPITKEAH